MQDGDLPAGTALVLSGGGARGAYEVGAMAGLVEVLRRQDPTYKLPLDLFTGTSVGAIHAAFYASHAHKADFGVQALVDIWQRMTVETYVRFTPRGLFRRGDDNKGRGNAFGPCLIDSGPFEKVVTESIDWAHLHKNIDSGLVSALVVAALDLADGRTTMFAEVGEQTNFEPSRDPRRTARRERLNAEHILASAAIPLVFPARRVGGRFYVDGGLRFNTPIAPAIRAGASRLIIIALSMKEEPGQPDAQEELPPTPTQYPDLTFLAGKVLDALLLDPISYDLQILRRFNSLAELLDDALTPEERLRVDELLKKTRGVPYRKLDTLVLQPSEDIGVLAGHHLRKLYRAGRLGWLPRIALGRVMPADGPWEVDLASYLLFDGEFASALIDLGRRDVLARTDEVLAFFEPR